MGSGEAGQGLHRGGGGQGDAVRGGGGRGAQGQVREARIKSISDFTDNDPGLTSSSCLSGSISLR